MNGVRWLRCAKRGRIRQLVNIASCVWTPIQGALCGSRRTLLALKACDTISDCVFWIRDRRAEVNFFTQIGMCGSHRSRKVDNKTENDIDDRKTELDCRAQCDANGEKHFVRSTFALFRQRNMESSWVSVASQMGMCSLPLDVHLTVFSQ
jgi:hypothetical protein